MVSATGRRVLCVLAVTLATCVGRAKAEDRPYDPLAVSDPGQAETLALAVEDAERGREIPLRIYLPAGKAPAPVVILSHGLGGSALAGPSTRPSARVPCPGTRSEEIPTITD